jgi:hypothetical protein
MARQALPGGAMAPKPGPMANRLPAVLLQAGKVDQADRVAPEDQ